MDIIGKLLGAGLLLSLLFWSKKASGVDMTTSNNEALQARQVPPTRTPIDKLMAWGFLHDAAEKALGRMPTKEEVAMLWAQSSFETRYWQAMWCWNFGNSVLGSNKSAKWFALQHKDPSENAHRYRAFGGPAEGAEYYVELLKSRHPSAFALLGTGDWVAYAHALKESGYFTADENSYAGGLRNRYAEALKVGT